MPAAPAPKKRVATPAAKKPVSSSTPKVAAADAYTPPLWSAPPEHKFELEVLKDGKIVETVDVSKRTNYIFGRQPDCDVVVNHLSISRRHCVLQYREGGDIFLYDLGSSHGTFLNKERMPPNEYVPLHVGDLFHLGASSRRYIFNGPDDLKPPEAERPPPPPHIQEQLDRLKQLNQKVKPPAPKPKPKADDGISWGMSAVDDADIYAEDEEDDYEVMMAKLRNKIANSTLSDKQAKTLEKKEKKEQKIRNMMYEIEVIRKKEFNQDGGLTEGQQRQIERNETHIAQLQQEVEQLEQTLWESFEGTKKGSGLFFTREHKKKEKKADGEYDSDDELSSDDDEFYDRTKAKKITSTAKVETQQTPQQAVQAVEDEIAATQAKKDKLELQLKDFRERKTAAASATSASASGGGGGGGDDDDSLDSFMQSVTSSVKSEKKSTIQKELNVLEIQLAKLRQTLSAKRAQAIAHSYNASGGKAMDFATLLKQQKAEEAKMRQEREREQSKQQQAEATQKQQQQQQQQQQRSEPDVAKETKEKEEPVQSKDTATTTAAAAAKATKSKSQQAVMGSLGDVVQALKAKQQLLQQQAEAEEAEERRRLEESQRAAEKEKEEAEKSRSERTQKLLDMVQQKKMQQARTGILSSSDFAAMQAERLEQHMAQKRKADSEAHSTSSSSSSSSPLVDEAMSSGGGGLLVRKKARASGPSAIAEGASSSLDTSILARMASGQNTNPILQAKKSQGPVNPYDAFSMAAQEREEAESVDWTPPQNQAGDGKTHLNAKFGY